MIEDSTIFQRLKVSTVIHFGIFEGRGIKTWSMAGYGYFLESPIISHFHQKGVQLFKGGN